VFDDGSKEMLSGCPDCGGNKFQFHPAGKDVPDEPDTAAEPPDPPTPDSSVARTVGSAAATVRDFVGRGSGEPEPGHPSEDPTSADPAPETAGDPDPGAGFAEDAAQADARSQVVSPDEIPTDRDWSATDDADPSSAPEAGETAATDPDFEDPAPEDRPDLKELREELNDQFESIKVLKPGHYELNLMELYDREEYIIALQEDGRYTIQVPETWHD
jgi:predicted  nucleic acid-binding Zn-ribbon protein